LARIIESCDTYHRFYQKTLLADISPGHKTVSSSPKYPTSSIDKIAPSTPPPSTTSPNAKPQSTPPVQKVPCANCGKPVKADWKKCPYCAKDLVFSPPSLLCANCGCEIEPDFKICPECGAPIKASPTCPWCSKPVNPDDSSCSQCKNWLKRPEKCCDVVIKPNWKKCPKCEKSFPTQ